MVPFYWTRDHVAGIGSTAAVAPVFARAPVPKLAAGLDIWDHWPVLEANGRLATIGGGVLVVALSAPAAGDPDDRHARARLRLFHRKAGIWRDLDDLLPDGFSPGSREWAGSAIVDRSHRRLTLHFTAAGTRGESTVGFGQRLFATTAILDPAASDPRPAHWSQPVETVAPGWRRL